MPYLKAFHTKGFAVQLLDKIVFFWILKFYQIYLSFLSHLNSNEFHLEDHSLSIVIYNDLAILSLNIRDIKHC